MSQYIRPTYADSKFQPDTIFGIILMVLSGLELGGAILVALIGGAAFSFVHVGLGAGIFALLMILLVPLAIVKFIAGYGMMAGRQWSFIVAIIFTILAAAAPWNVILLVYSILRLTGSVGPKPA